MQYEMKLMRRKKEHENGKILLCTVKYPSFFSENGDVSTQLDEVTSFYREFAERLCTAIEKGATKSLADKYSADTVSLEATSCVTRCDDEEISVYINVRHYADRTLAALSRYSQNWERSCRGNKESVWQISRPPKLKSDVKRGAKEAGMMPFDGFYKTETATVLFCCRFRDGDGVRLRRSKENKFFSELSFGSNELTNEKL